MTTKDVSRLVGLRLYLEDLAQQARGQRRQALLDAINAVVSFMTFNEKNEYVQAKTQEKKQ